MSKSNIIKVIIIGLFLIMVASQSQSKFLLDEIDFPAVAKATSESGRPVYYRGEENKQHIGIYHPTLYINTLAAYIRIWGYSENNIRAFGAICTLITALLIVLISRQIISDKNILEFTENIFLFVFLIHPYTIANTTLPDIDTTVLPITMLCFIYFLLKSLKNNKFSLENFKTVVILGLLFALNLWAKITTPLILIPFLAVFLKINHNSILKSVLLSLKVFIIGLVFFLITYFIYCKIVDLPFSYTFEFLYASFFKGTSGNIGLISKILENISYGRTLLNWILPEFIFIFIVSIIGLFRIKSSETSKTMALFALVSIIVTLFYVALIAPFGGFFKYPFPVFSLICLIISFFIANNIKNKISKKVILVFLCILGFSFLLNKSRGLFGISGSFNIVTLNYIYLLLVAGSVFFYIIKKLLISKTLFLVFFTFILGALLSMSYDQAKSQFSTKYLFGQTGINETVEYLKANTDDNEVIWSMKDIGYYVNNRYIENYGFLYDPKGENNLKELLSSNKLKYYIMTTGIGEDKAEIYTNLSNVLNKEAILVKRFGNYLIYKDKDL